MAKVKITLVTPASPVSGTVPISATVTPAGQVTRVEFWIEGELKGTDTSSPYQYSWNTTTLVDGSYTVLAKGFYSRNQVATSQKQVTVTNTVPTPPPPPPAGPPTATSTIQTNGTVTQGDVWTVTTNPDTTLLEFWADGALIGTDTTEPYTEVIDLTPGVHALNMIGTFNGVKTSFGPGGIYASNVTVNAAAPPPTLTFTSTVEDTDTVARGVTWSVTTNPNASLVEFWADGFKLGEDASEPYTQVLDLVAGAHQLGLVIVMSDGVRQIQGTNGIYANITVTDASGDPPPGGTIIAPAPANLASIHAAAASGAQVRLGVGYHGDQTLTLDKPITFIGDPGAVLGDVRVQTSAGSITFQNLGARDFWLGETALSPGQSLARRAQDIRIDTCDFRLFNINAAERITVIHCDIGPSHNIKSHITTSNPGDHVSAIPYDVLIEDCHVHDVTMDVNGAHVEGILIYAGNGVTLRNNRFARCQGTGDIYLATLNLSPPIPVMTNTLLTGNLGSTEQFQQDPDAYFNLQIDGDVAGNDWNATYNSNTWPKGYIEWAPTSHPAATYPAPPGWPR